MARLLYFQLLMGCLFFNIRVEAALVGDFHGDLYSETYYDSRFDGAVTDTRFYNYLHLLEDYVRPYGGFHFTRDLSNDGAPLSIENAFMPTLGVELNLFNRPYISVFGEKRWILRTESLNGKREDEEFRVGLIYYHKQYLVTQWFAETYGEWIQIDRVSETAVFTTWMKLGYRFNLSKIFSFEPFFEGFTRQSANLGYGPTENELRSGVRVNSNFDGFYVGVLVNHSMTSNINPGGFDALLVLSSRFY